MAGSKTILFIEDDPFVVEMYKHALDKAGYTVDVAYDGQEGYQKASQQNYDLLLVDIMVPEMTGIEILEKLRQDRQDRLKETKIVVLTNLAQDDESRRALEAEADGYLIKADITPKKLVQILANVLGNTSASVGSDA